ncbi:nonribosomal peptide synthase [Fusarium austroafricanum]|uniref:Nonribosomal peptide synthase n=1 Tax=Fusarium austroafricanum TaxID=2364996 RepID=A0A8H4PCH7_9HYPO|nr:nonribosomal peptide synthase [Fusarium austroafricanum]
MTLLNGKSPLANGDNRSIEPPNGKTKPNGYTKHEMPIPSAWQRYLVDIDHAAVSLFDLPKPNDPVVTAKSTHRFGLGEETLLVSNPSTICAAFAIVMSEYSNSQDVLFGVRAGGRVVPLRVLVNENDQVSSFLDQVESKRKMSQDFPPDITVPAIHNVLAFVENKLPTSGNGLVLEEPKAISMEISLNSKEIAIHVLFNRACVDPVTLQRFLKQLETVFHQLCKASAGQSVEEVKSITADDIRDMASWNSACLTPYTPECIHDVVKQHVLISPNSCAVHGWDGDLSYAQLDEESSRLANYLYRLGVRPHDMVPLAFHKSIWFTICALALSRLGAAIVPLDPQWPKDRQMYIINDIESRRIITNIQSPESAYAGLEIIDISQLSLVNESDTANYPVTPEHAIYAYYTSGTTGQPKGCVIEHGAFVSSSLERAKFMGRNRDSRVLQVTTYTFDATMEDIFITLMTGGCICVPSREECLNDIAGAVEKYNSNTLHVAPSLARNLQPSQVPSLRALFLGGEAMSASTLRTWAGSVALYNSYGPTECCVVSCMNLIQSPDENPRKIGRPKDCSYWLVRPGDIETLAAIGTVGEILIHGPNLGRGYLNKPDLTAKAFLQNISWASEVGLPADARFYRTGDLARFNADGSICVLGRVDDQVKIHGQRIELGEIDYRLSQCLPAGIEAISGVVNFRDRDFATLVAFIQTINSDSNPADSSGSLALADNWNQFHQLRSDVMEQLSHNLPTYMVPSVFLPVQNFLYFNSAKLNRRGMCQQASQFRLDDILSTITISGQETQYVSSLSAEATVLRQLWALALGLDEKNIHPDSSFADLGGDSLAAIRLGTLCRSHDILLSVDDILQQSTILLQAETSEMKKNKERKVAPAASLPVNKRFGLLSQDVDVGVLCEQASAQCQIDSGAIDDMYPASPLQESLMALSMDDSPYVSQFVFRIPAKLDMYRFRKAWKSVFSDIPILRTRIICLQDFGTLQVVVDEDIDWTEHKNITLLQFLKDDQERLMQVGDRLVRFAVVQETPETSFLVWTCHHACHDGRTVDQTLKIVVAKYLDRPVSSPAPYHRYIQFQQDLYRRDWQEYWTRSLAGASVSAFPAQDNAVHRPVTDASYQYSFAMPRSSTDKFNTSVFSSSSILRAAWALIVSRYEESDDVTFGTIVGANASAVADADAIVGPTNNTIPIRVLASEGWTVEAFVSHVKQQFEYSPFQHIGLANLKDISPEMQDIVKIRNLFIVQSHFVGQTGSEINLETVPVSAHEGFKYPLVVECFQENANQLFVNFIYDSHILDQSQISRLALQLENTIHLLSNNPHKTLNEIEILSPSDISQILEWQVDVPPPSSFCLHQQFFSQVKKSPDSIALCTWEGQFTYLELQNLVDSLAMYLQDAGLRHGDRVLYQIEKSACAVISILATLKLGATCVPLGATWPRIRSEVLAADTMANFLLVSPTLSNALVGLVPSILEVSTSFIQGLPRPTYHVDSVYQPSDLAFILFTSGSTGTPKGVQLTHSGLVTNLTLIGQHMGYTSDTRLFQFSDFSFDLSIYDIFGMLMIGGCICMPSEQERHEDLMGSMNRMKVDTVASMPSVAKMIKPSSVPTLRRIRIGGEALDSTTLATFAGSIDTQNGYGVTECSVWSTSTNRLSPDSDPMNVGRAVNCYTWIVDTENPNRLRPIGAVGELIMQGPGVALGYLNKPEESKRVFLDALPWSADKGRAYRTGDLVKYAPDGSLIYVQRKDAQLKIRGQRFEPSEVESHLQQCGLPERKFCVDLVQTQTDPVVVVFLCTNKRVEMKDASDLGIVPLDHQDSSIVDQMAQAMRMLIPRLPSYMIPQAVIPVTQMPVSNSGKLDRRALRSLVTGMTPGRLRQLSRPSEDSVCQKRTALETGAERTMALLWSQVLPIDESHVFHIDDDFFQLGGHSITLMRLISAGRSRGMSISYRDAFLHSSLGAMSRQVTVSNEEAHVLPRSIQPFAMAPSDVDRLIQEASRACRIEPQDIVDLYPCTPFQESMMTLSLSKLGLYTAQFVWSLPDTIDLTRLKSAWETMVECNAILRTRIIYSSTYWQVVTSTGIDFTVTDASIDSYLNNDKARPIRLGEPLNRLAIIRDQSSMTQYLVWTGHHSTYDGHSLSCIQDWLSDLYTQGGGKPPLVPFNVFVDHIVSNPLPETGVSFWKDMMSGARMPSFPKLPLNNNLQSTNSVVTQSVSLPGQTRSDVTVASAIQAAWAVLLGQYENSDDVLFAATLSGRNAAVDGIENIAGPTSCTVPLRVRIDQGQDISSWLRSVQQSYVDAATYGQIGMNSISLVNKDAEVARHIRSLLIVQAPAPKAVSGLERIGCRKIETDAKGFLSYALVVECTPSMESDGMEVMVSYDANVLDEPSVHRLVWQLQFTLQQLLSDNCKTIGEMCLASPSDMETISTWNRELTKTVDTTVHALFGQRLSQKHNATAITSWDGEMTYAELDNYSSLLAAHLMALGVRPGNYIPLCFEKTMWMVVSMLAVLKAGGACVCLDPNHPSRHHQVILSRVSAEIVITSPANQSKFPDHRVLSVSASSMTKIARDPYIAPLVDSDQPAFVVFTSGTTGEPKGIVLEHRALCTSIQAHGQFMEFGPESRVLQFASYTFDVSIAEILTTLVFGGCICIPSDQARLNNLSGAIKTLRANQAYLTASVAALLDPGTVDGSLKILSVGGEQVGQDVLTRWGDRTKLLNMYGPAETTIWCGGKHSVKPGDDAANIGYGVGARMWLTDVNDVQKLAPIGAVGEIVIEGPLLARGYINGNNTVFVESPNWAKAFDVLDGFDQVTGRVYRSGDLGRYQSDGSIVICGRRDTQLKIRGQRVEVSQIEDQLQRLAPDFKCVVGVIGTGTPTLVAFIGLERPSQDQRLTDNMDLIVPSRDLSAELRDLISGLESQLANILPPYSVPAHYLVLRRIPLMTSGKTDRKKLQLIASEHLEHSRNESKPQSLHQVKKIPTTEMEWNLFGLWAQVLGVNNLASLGTDDNFFRCGGDSLKAMQLASLASQRGITLQVSDVFKHPILADLAQALVLEVPKVIETSPVQESPEPYSLLSRDTEEQTKAQAALDCGVSPDIIEDIYPCTPLQDGLFALSQKQPGAYVAQFKFSVANRINIRHLRQAWETVCDQAPILRSRLVSTPSGIVQVVLTEDFWWYEQHHIDISAELEKDKAAIGGLGQPLQRFRLVQDVMTGQKNLVWSLHHAAYDGWSIQRILERVRLVYQDQPVPSPCVPFNTFIKYTSSIVESHESTKFWQSYLSNITPPTFPALPSPTYQALADTVIDSKMPNLELPDSFTLTTVLRAAWAIVVGTYQRSDDVVFLTTVFGRNAPLAGIDTIIGPTITTIPIREGATETMAYEQLGLQSIRNISTDCKAACMAQNLLVIQTSHGEDVNVAFDGFEKLPDEAKGFSTIPFTLECTATPERGLSIEASFDSKVVDPAQANRIIKTFEHVTQQMCCTHLKLSQVDLISHSDHDLISSLNSTMPCAKEECIHHQLDRLAASNPDAEAVCAWDGNFTFNELNFLSNRYAAYLQTQGIQPGVFVPFCFDKSKWVVVAMLAIMKAGAASVTIDPKHPPGRRDGILSAVSASAVVTTPVHAHLFDSNASHGLKTLLLDEETINNIPNSLQAAEIESTPNDAAFVVYTSGSTGTPKAVVIEHRGICTGALHLSNLLHLGPQTRCLQFAAYTFDQSFGDIFHTLLLGGCVCIPSESDRMNDLVGSILRLKANTAILTPTVACSIDPHELGSHKMDVLTVGGEPVTAEVIRTWAPHVRLFNTYGPAECSVTTIGRPIDMRNITQPANIGRGLGALVWLTYPDDPERLTPIGTVGEILMEGPQLARGYLNDSKNTNAAYITDPAWSHRFPVPGMSAPRRFYRTGDLGQYQADGTIVCLGRRDSQVKLRGQRMELGEVEHHISTYTQSAVEIIADVFTPPNGAAMLVACISFKDHETKRDECQVEDDEQMLTRFSAMLSGLDSYLSRMLPSYMIPTLYMPVTHIPLTASGKKDRKSIRLMLAGVTVDQLKKMRTILGESEPSRPLTEREKDLQQLWAKVLKLDGEIIINANANFFHSGGDSVRAMALVAAARKEDTHLTVADIFSHPKLCDMAAITSSLSQKDQPVQLAPYSLLRSKPSADTLSEACRACGVDQSQIQDIYPATPLQQALVALSIKDSGSYVSNFVFLLPSHLDVELFQRGWEQVYASSHALRTRVMDNVTAGMLQVVVSEKVQWSHGDNLEEFVGRQLQNGFKLGQSMAKSGIVRQKDGKTFFILTLHHAIYDGWSLRRLLEATEQIYRGQTIPRFVTFNYFVDHVARSEDNHTRVFWRSCLEGVPMTSFIQQATTAYKPTADHIISQDVTLSDNFTARSGVTITSLIRAAWALVLTTYNGDKTPDVVFGTVVGGRSLDLADIEYIDGPTIATIPFRVTFDPAAPVDMLLQGVQNMSTQILQHEQFGMQNIIKVSDDARLACDFETLLVVQDSAEIKASSGFLDMDNLYQRPDKPPRIPLVVECSPSASNLHLEIHFDAKLLEETQAKRLIRQLAHVIKQLANSAPSLSLSCVDMINPADAEEIKNWNRQPPPTFDGYLHEMVLQNAKDCPDRIAIQSWDTSLTYSELDHLSAILAQYLNSLGVRPEVKVPFCMDKSAFAIVVMLATLRSGGCFVPLDMSSPIKRLKNIIKRVNAKLILVSPKTRPLFEDLEGRLDLVEVTRSMINGLPKLSKSLYNPSPSHPAYVLFTSGSTGTPKGVVVEHGAIATSVSSFSSYLGFTPDVRVLQFAPYVFDVSIGEIFACLVSGGCLCIASEPSLMDGLPLCIQQLNVNVAVLTPTFAQTVTPSEVPTLQTLVLGGEPLRKKDVETWASAVKLFNGYGPTEASVLAMAHCVPDSQSPCNLIGLSVGCRSWIVSPSDPNIILPIGAVGELVLEGNTLARGYLDTESAEEAFMTDPKFLDRLVPEARGSRVYKTGDLVRYNTDGVVEFVSRKDTQVKFHGRRIELEDIEHNAMETMPEAKHLVVELVRPGNSQHEALALFFHTKSQRTANEEQPILPIEADLRARLRAIKSNLAGTLPSYMVPSLYIPLSSWPSTSNGKLNRHLLRSLVSDFTSEAVATYSLHTGDSSALSSDKERQLAQLWATTLNIDARTIGSSDSFFQHGGDSIAAVRLVTLAREQAIGLSVETLLSKPILRDMALSMASVQPLEETIVKPFSQIYNRQEEVLLAASQFKVEPAMIEDIYPCSALQNSLMAVSLKNTSAYLSQFVVAIPEGLDIEVLQAAWNTVYSDSPILRTRFYQPSLNNMQHPMLQAVVDEEPKWGTEESLHDFLQRDKQTPTSLGSPLTRFTIVVDKATQERFFVLTAHHAVYDGWSIASTFEKVEMTLKGVALPKSVGYNNFIHHVQSLNAEANKAFWSSTLKGATQTLFPQLPSRSYEPATDDFLEHQFSYPADLAPHSTVTMATILRGAWGLLVSKYCDSSDVVFGTTVNGRMASIPGIEMVQGPTIATIPFRAQSSTDQSILSYLEQLHVQQIESIPHEQYGLPNIKHLSEPIARVCEFQNLLVIQSSRESSLSDSSFAFGTVKNMDQGLLSMRGFHNMALVVECTIDSAAIHITVNFDSNVVPKAQVRRIACHFEHLILQLQEGSAQSDLKMDQIDHVSPSDQAEILEWNSSIPGSIRSRVHELFESRAHLQPSAPAICARDGQLTYFELETKATTLAAYLDLQGLGRGVLVPLLFEKSCWAIVAMMAVLKAGAANVTLNPEHPQARLEDSINATQGEVILCSRKYLELASSFDAQVIVVDQDLFHHIDPPSLTSSDPWSPTRSAGPDDPCFVLFTSGTTGKPKGIVINHAAMCSSINGHSSTLRYSTGPGSRNFQFTAYTSDVSIGEIFTSLAVGSCVCVPSDYDRMNNLASSMRDLNVNWAFLTPSVAALLKPEEVPSLRTLLFGGETATPENISTWADSLYLINSAGPAECCIWTHCNPGISTADIGSNWGYNLGCATWITDPNNPSVLMPIGVTGEMLIEGPNLAQGYLNDPERTQKAFVEIRLASKKRRLYRTGDLARLMADGKTQFLGRRDTQVKLRGQRVEIGEIENQIRRHIPDSTLVAVEMVRIAGGKSAPLLAAFHAPKDPQVTDKNGDITQAEVLSAAKVQELGIILDQLAAKLAEILPQHMIPTAFIPLTSMPLTASAKTDRNALSALASTISVEQLSYYALTSAEKQFPSSPAEQQMAKLWQEVLDIKIDIGIHDSFFRIGGDSISAMHLVSRGRAVGISLTVEQIFKNPTLQHMAAIATTFTESMGSITVEPFSLIPQTGALDNVCSEAQEQCQVTAQQIQDIYPCSALQEGLLALSLKTSGSYLAQMVFEIPDELNLDRFKDAWAHMVAKDAPILRTRFFESPSQGHQLMQAVIDAPLEWTYGDNLDEYLMTDSTKIVQLGQPTSRYAIISDAQSFFVFTAHHAIYDGASLGPMFEAVERVYSEKLLKPSSPYSLFVQYLLGMDSDSSKAYWEMSLQGAPAPTFPRLPSIDYRPMTNDALKRTIALPARHDTEFTMSSIVRAAWSLVVASYSDTDDIVFASTVGGRTLPIAGIENIIGPTLATVPVRVTIDRNASVSDFLTMIQEQSTSMMPHEQYGLQNIKRISSSISAASELHNLLVINTSSVEGLGSGALGLKQVDLGRADGFHNFALSIECTAEADSLSLAVSFDNHVIDPRQIRRVVDQLEHMLQQISTCGVHTRLADMNLTGPADMGEIQLWNSHVPPPQQTYVHTLVVERVNSQPDAPAVCSWEGELTYRQLDELSSSLANHLISTFAVVPGTLIPILFEKSIWTVVTMLAVLKAGGANVPMDPEQPLARLQELAADIGATLAISSSKYQDKSRNVTPRSMFVDREVLTTMDKTRTCPTSAVSYEDPAFILFTSGSTGKPKAILIDHTAFTSSINGHGEILRYRKGSRNLQFTAYISDVSIGEIFTSLSAGACVCVPSDFERMNDLAGAINRMRVDWAFLTPSVASLLDATKVPSLKTLVFGGETATPENIAVWAPRLFLVNSFGPAECSIWTHCDPGVDITHNGSHIGYAIGCATWIVDPNDYNKLVPIGSIGELIVEGPNVARGYLDEAKTKEAFLETAAWIPNGRKNRLYKMGDLVRYLPDGKVQFLGRKDSQVKLHGQRIELGEIEHQLRVALAKQDADRNVQVAVEMVSLGTDSSASSLLTAFVDYEGISPDDGPARLSSGEKAQQWARQTFKATHDHLALTLPRHMIPSMLLPLTRMPLNGSAKTDRKVLKQIVSGMDTMQRALYSLATGETSIIKATTPNEKTLHHIWSDILSISPESFGVEANFMSLGGDSIAAMKMIPIAQAAGLSISVEDLFTHPVLRDLARVFHQGTTEQSQDIPPFSLVEQATNQDELLAEASVHCNLPPDAIQDIYPCTQVQEQFISTTEIQPGAYTLQDVFKLSSDMDLVRLKQAWTRTVTSHVALRTRIFLSNDRHQHLQVVQKASESLDWIHSENLEEYLKADKAKSMRYGESLVRSALVSEDVERHLVITYHHSIYDAVSLGIIMSDLEAFYLDDTYELKEPKYNAFVHHLTKVKSQELSSQFWREHLAGNGSIITPLYQSVDGGRVDSLLRHTVAFPMHYQQSQLNMTVAAFTYAALSLVTARLTGSSSAVLELTLLGRSVPVKGIERMVGTTVTSAPLRIDITAGDDKPWTVKLKDYLDYAKQRSSSIVLHEHTCTSDPETKHITSAALPIVVHPSNPHKEALGTGIGLQRHEIQSMGQSSSVFYMDIAALDGEGLEINLPFDSRIVDRGAVIRLTLFWVT